MPNFFHQAKGYVMTGVAFVACPCHLPITLPILISVTAGTALGSWLAGNVVLITVISSLLFVGGLVLGMTWLGSRPSNNEKPLYQANRRQPTGKPAQVTLLTSQTCRSCVMARKVWQIVAADIPLRIDEVDISSARGRDLAAKHNIFSTPTSIINGRVAFRGVPKLGKVAAALEV